MRKQFTNIQEIMDILSNKTLSLEKLYMENGNLFGTIISVMPKEQVIEEVKKK